MGQSSQKRVESVDKDPINISWSDRSCFLEFDMDSVKRLLNTGDDDMSFDGSPRSCCSFASMESEWRLDQDEFPRIGNTRQIVQNQNMSGMRGNELQNQEKEKLLNSLGLSDQTAVEEFNSVVEETFREASASWSASIRKQTLHSDRLELGTGTWDKCYPPGFELKALNWVQMPRSPRYFPR